MSFYYTPFWDFVDSITDQVDSLNRELKDAGVTRDINNKNQKQVSKSNNNVNKQLNKWDPFSFNFDNDIDGLFTPAIDVYNNDKHVEVHASIPGADPKNVNIEFDSNSNQLTISGETESSSEEKKKDLTIKERRSGSFKRTVQLSKDIEIDEENIKAKYNNGVLELVIPKKAESVAPKRKITIENL